MRFTVALAVIAIAWSSAVYIHQRESVVGSKPATSIDIFHRPAVYGRSSWQDPAAVVIAIGGLAVAAAILTARRR